MNTDNDKSPQILRDLGDGLILRRSTPADAEALASFNARIHSEEGPEKPDERVGAWVRDLLEKPHPTFHPGDFTLVEDTKTGLVVSSLNLIDQTWAYAGIPFGVGRPELVGTLPEYRNRGLVRAQFEVIHQWSAERGQLVQGITGIPYYYRLFGYEMALTLGGGRVGYKPHVPKLEEGKSEPYLVRQAVEADLDFLVSLHLEASKRSLVNCIWDRAAWEYELCGKSEKNANRVEVRIIETAGRAKRSTSDQQVGYLLHSGFTWGPTMVAVGYALKKGMSWAEVTPSVVRYLFKTGEAYATRDGKEKDFAAFGFWLGTEHPVYQVLKDSLPRVRKPYAWYIRVPDLPGFLRHITPALEKRLKGSNVAGASGELKLTFYRSGLKLILKNGHIVSVDAWQPTPQGHSGDAAFPELTFLQLLFGYRSLDELNYAFADCWWENDRAYSLLTTLFPKLHSDFWAIS